MWKVEFESKDVEKKTQELIKKKMITPEDRIVISSWIRQIQLEGPLSVQGDKRWSDHELYDEWKGYRSSCFSYSGRIIYKVKDNIVTILIARITHDHDYRR